ncbi:MaoC family dehydratase [Oceanomicrobium pacificus]|uniref:Uncharacterized protein n=1 Tax=Oceanomicrobium pacificus TaxID=2692916 RepID=A0A6B0TJD5_9RHOB|nr:MaoC family dehydratase [Oceanomicrobium pacificus]MXU64507.1 hypothetical protein [Oceanomicrobium pacificus]
MAGSAAGLFFEDYSVGQQLHHAVPRTVTAGERALYTALYPTRVALYSSDEVARASGLRESPIEDLAAFHIVFGKSVPDVSRNAVANLGYAEGRFHRPVFAGDTLSARSEVIGLKQNSNGKTGIVWVRTEGQNQHGETVIDFCRWVMVRKRDLDAPAPQTVVPDLAGAVAVSDVPVPQGLDFTGFDTAWTGDARRWADYKTGDVIDHVDGVTVEDAEHMMATRLWQNTAKVHFDRSARPDGRRLVYGGHVLSMARALAHDGLANLQMVAAINGGAHANPCFAGDRISAWSEVLDVAETGAPGVGALRLRLVAVKDEGPAGALRDPDGRYRDGVLLDFDYWGLIPV